MNKNVSLMLKGIAIVMMLSLHLFYWNYGGGVTYLSIPLGSYSIAYYIGVISCVCVYMFSFLSGYGLFYSYEKENSLGKIYIRTLKKIISFVISYWLILLVIFFPFYMVSCSGNPDWIYLLKSLIGFGGLNIFSWYVYFYIFALLTLPLARYLLVKNKWISLIISFVPLTLIYIILALTIKDTSFYDAIVNCLLAYIPLLIGYTFAKYDLFNYVYQVFKKKWLIILLSSLLYVGLSITFIFFRKGILLPLVVIPLMILLVTLFSYNVPKVITYPLTLLGKNSMNMWFIHAAIFTGYINQYIHLDTIIYYPKVAIVILIFALLVTLLISIPFTYVDGKINKILNKTN